MHRRSLRTSGAVVAAAVCALALVAVPAASAADYYAPKVSFVPVNGTDFPATTTTVAASATVTPGESQDSIPTPYYYVLLVLDLNNDAGLAAPPTWSELIDVPTESLTLSADDIPVEQGHEYVAAVAVTTTPILDENLGVVGMSFFTVGLPVTAAFTYPQVTDASGYWCGAGWTIPQVVEVTFTGPLQAQQTYSVVWSAPNGSYQIASQRVEGPLPSLELSGTFSCETEGDYTLKAFQGDTLLAELAVHVAVVPQFVWPMREPSPNPFAPRAKAVMSQTVKILTGGHLTLQIWTSDSDGVPGVKVYQRDYGMVKSGRKMDLTWNGIPAGAKKPVYGDYLWYAVLTNDHGLGDVGSWPITIVPYRS